MIRRSLKDFYEKHKNDSDLRLSWSDKTEIVDWLNDNKFHSILRSQITMNSIPKRIKKEQAAALRGPHEVHTNKHFSERVISASNH